MVEIERYKRERDEAFEQSQGLQRQLAEAGDIIQQLEAQIEEQQVGPHTACEAVPPSL